MAKPPIIIGAGHNGLVAAFYLARAGLKPLVLERRPSVGGAAATAELSPGVRGPALAHAFGPLRASIVRDMRLEERGVEFLRPDPAVVAFAPDGRSAAFYREHGRTQQSLARISARDAAAYAAFAETLERLARVMRDVLEMTPPDIDRPDAGDLWKVLKAGRRFRALPKGDKFRLLRWMPMAVADLVGEFFESDLVQAAIAARALAGSNLGPWSAGTGALLLLYAAADPLPAGSSVTARGGPGAITQAMAAAAVGAGAQIRTSAEVAGIETGARGIEAVRLGTGEAIAASVVISNADPRRTFLSLLDPTVLEPGFVSRIMNYRSRGTTAKINLVVGSRPAFPAADGGGEAAGRIHLGPGVDDLEQAFDASKYGRYSARPWLDVTVPTNADPTLADGGRHVVSVVAHFAPYRLRDGNWSAAADAFADAVLRTLDEHAPGLSASVIARQVLTPKDLEDQFALTGGHIHHGEPALDQLFLMRPVMGWARYRTPVKGLYLCGAGTHPGPGLTGASGRNAAREILRDLK